ncbi:DUF349 domain-containing protein [Alteromonas sp. McT4-15]|uniref:DUF349 domain-containing protein n=1 Tax=Alteromonas sp. McT4-15 TaxID=2881256 RepID=UPI001CF862D3|nr:DUF349 domain-containing protein [Alteromonas sp. McT4-15]MCB4435822.1 DUF349 domain-containing protein [Alteromonas sp. McT4-15]
MIFSRLFAPAHASSKPEKRIQAIESLSPEKATEKTILHELAFNDDNADVSLAALNKLNVFALWLKMSQIARAPKVKRVCEQKVNDAILGQSDIALRADEKASFLTESANSELIIQIVQRDPSLLDDDELSKQLMTKISKPSFTQFVFSNTSSEALRQHIVNEESDVNVLQKLTKKVHDESIRAHIDARIDAIRLADQKPVELKKQLTLCLSKYQALLDKPDVQFVIEQQAHLESELKGLMFQCDVLDTQDKALFEEKQARIAEQVERYLARIRPAWEEQQKALEIANTKALCDQQLDYATQQVNWLFQERLCDATLADVATVNESVRGLEATIEQLGHLMEGGISDNRLRAYSDVVAVLNEKLDSFSMQQQYGQKLLVRLQSLEELASKIDAQDGDVESTILSEFNEAKQGYNEVKSTLIQLPNTFAQRFNTANKRVNAKAKAFKAKQASSINAIKKQLTLIDNLIAQGKFRVAMAKFNKLKVSFEALSESAKVSLEKRYQKTCEDVSRLAGWQDYLAAPRKPALVEEAKALAESPAENIKARSDAIKYLRQQWLSLTSIQSENSEDDTLQQAFDIALEQAFEPCRAYYAELDAKRSEALETRQRIIEAAQALDVEMPAAELAKAYDKLSKQWHSAGQVERTVYENLKHEWKAVSSVLVDKINAWQRDNQQQKRTLISSVKMLLDNEDMANAATEAQQLQAQWKQVGHAGKREESRLWAEFKAVNDAVFEKLKAQRQSQSSAFDKQVSELDAAIAVIDIHAHDFDERIHALSESAQSLPKALRSKLEKKIARLETNRDEAELNKQEQMLKQKVNALVSLVQSKVTDLSEDEASLKATLGKRWTSLLEHSTQVDDTANTLHDRQWLTVALEVSTDMPSPEQDASIRSSVQLQMMTAKLEQGVSSTASDILADWLTVATITESDKPFIQRLSAVLNAHPEVLA